MNSKNYFVRSPARNEPLNPARETAGNSTEARCSSTVHFCLAMRQT
jgi:hypothetical protein